VKSMGGVLSEELIFFKTDFSNFLYELFICTSLSLFTITQTSIYVRFIPAAGKIVTSATLAT
jgi:hypothetical protein